MTQYIEIHKAKSFFTPNAFVHNIISNSAAPIDTQITKTFLQPNIYGIVPIIIKPKNLYEIKSTYETNASNSRAKGLDLFREL